jgi:hypothetical protein
MFEVLVVFPVEVFDAQNHLVRHLGLVHFTVEELQPLPCGNGPDLVLGVYMVSVDVFLIQGLKPFTVSPEVGKDLLFGEKIVVEDAFGFRQQLFLATACLPANAVKLTRYVHWSEDAIKVRVLEWCAAESPGVVERPAGICVKMALA